MATTGRGRRQRPHLADETAFTLIELLVVIVVIGILAAIALPSLLDQRQKAADSSAKSSAKHAAFALESYRLQKGSYAASRSDILAIEPELGSEDLAVATSATAFTVTVTSASGHGFSISRAEGGGESRSCSPPDLGGCDGGAW